MTKQQFIDLEKLARKAFHNAIIKVYDKAFKDDTYLILGDHRGNPIKIYPARSQNMTEKPKRESKSMVSTG